MIKLLTEKEFGEIRQFPSYENYREQVRQQNRLTLEGIVIAITTVLKDRIPPDWLSVNTRQQDVMFARHYGRYIAHQFTKINDIDTARTFGGRDRTVVYNTLKVITTVQAGSPDHPRILELNKILDLLNESYND
jgi:chromosomal replication initiation ATPase DnaA